MQDEIKEIKFIEYNGIEGYIELMKHDVEPLNNPECKRIELYYDGKDIKAVLDYITNLQELIKKYDSELKHKTKQYEFLRHNESEEIERLNIIIDKAIEYIKEDMYVEPKELYSLVDGEHLLNILQGSENK